MDRRISIFDPARLFADSFKSTFFDELAFPGSFDEMEMFEEGDNLVVRMKTPGFNEKDIDISIENDVLVITGRVETKEEAEDKNRKFYFKELRQESFTKSVRLPIHIKAESTQAEVENGVLKVTMPKSEEAKPKKIQVKSVGK